MLLLVVRPESRGSRAAGGARCKANPSRGGVPGFGKPRWILKGTNPEGSSNYRSEKYLLQAMRLVSLIKIRALSVGPLKMRLKGNVFDPVATDKIQSQC